MSAAFRNQISVLIRFSYLAQSGFRLARQDPAAAAATLYDPDRLARRMRLFEALTLPTLIAQSDPDFTTILLTGPGLPQSLRARLEQAVAPLADARIISLPPLPMFAATRRAFNRARRPDLTHLTTVRLDDDDAMDCQMIARLKQMAAAGQALGAGDRPLVLAHHKGFFLDVASGQLSSVVERFPLGIGLAMVSPVMMPDTVFSRNHRLLPQFYNCYSEAETPAFIRSVHRDNDAEPHASGQSAVPDEAGLDAVLAARFGLSLSALRALAR